MKKTGKFLQLRWMFAAHVARLGITAIVPIVTLPHVAKKLGPSSLGLYQFSNAIVANFIILGTLGIPALGQRESAAVRHDAKLLKFKSSNLFVLGLIAAWLSYLLLLITSYILPNLRPNLTLISIIGASIPAMAFSAEWLLTATDDFVYISIRVILLQFLSAIGIFIFVQSPEDVEKYALLILAPQAIAALMNWNRIKGIICFRSTDFDGLRKGLRKTLPFFISALAISAYTNFDSIILGLTHTKDEVGEYGLAKRLVLAGITVSTSLGAVLAPRLTNSYSRSDVGGSLKLLKASLRFILFVSILLSSFIYLFRAELILLFGGQSYPRAASALAILAPTISIVGFAHLFLIQILIPQNRERQALYAWSIGGIVGLICGTALIPSFGLVGAAITCLISEITVTLLALIYVRGDLTAIPWRELAVVILLLAFSIAIFAAMKQNYFSNTRRELTFYQRPAPFNRYENRQSNFEH